MERIEDIIEEASYQISLKINDCLLKVAKGESYGYEIEFLLKDRAKFQKLWRTVRIKEKKLIKAGRDTNDLIKMVREEIDK